MNDLFLFEAVAGDLILHAPDFSPAAETQPNYGGIIFRNMQEVLLSGIIQDEEETFLLAYAAMEIM